MLELCKLGPVVHDYVRVVRIPPHEVLVIGFGGEEWATLNPGRDRPLRAQLRDEAGCNLPLRGVLREDRRAIARSNVGALPVHLRGVVGNREIDLQQLRVTDLARVEADPDRLGMARSSTAETLACGSSRSFLWRNGASLWRTRRNAEYVKEMCR